MVEESSPLDFADAGRRRHATPAPRPKCRHRLQRGDCQRKPKHRRQSGVVASRGRDTHTRDRFNFFGGLGGFFIKGRGRVRFVRGVCGLCGRPQTLRTLIGAHDPFPLGIPLPTRHSLRVDDGHGHSQRPFQIGDSGNERVAGHAGGDQMLQRCRDHAHATIQVGGIGIGVACGRHRCRQ